MYATSHPPPYVFINYTLRYCCHFRSVDIFFPLHLMLWYSIYDSRTLYNVFVLLLLGGSACINHPSRHVAILHGLVSHAILRGWVLGYGRRRVRSRSLHPQHVHPQTHRAVLPLVGATAHQLPHPIGAPHAASSHHCARPVGRDAL